MSVLFALVLSWPAFADAQKLRSTPEQILAAVARHKGITLRSDIPTPAVFLESTSPLQQFQDAVEPQWGIRPERFVNVYVVARNEIYLIDSADFYAPNNRFVDDSLAHELTHFLQVKYEGLSNRDDDELEADAVKVQTWFRETYFAL